jgi:hypothetical protein
MQPDFVVDSKKTAIHRCMQARRTGCTASHVHVCQASQQGAGTGINVNGCSFVGSQQIEFRLTNKRAPPHPVCHQLSQVYNTNSRTQRQDVSNASSSTKDVAYEDSLVTPFA